MQPLFAFLDITLLLTSCVGKESAMDSGLSQLYSQLDVEIEVSVGYAATTEERIADLCGRLVRISDGESRTPIIDRLIGEYEAYDAFITSDLVLSMQKQMLMSGERCCSTSSARTYWRTPNSFQMPFQ